jgi:S1-C subfamily serine protease
MKDALSYRSAIGIMAVLFSLTCAATFYVAISQGLHASRNHVADHLPGLTVEKAPNPQAGLVVTSLQSAGPAEQAGLAVGDDVLAVDQRAVGTLGELHDVLQRHRSQTIQLLVLHNDVPLDVSLDRSKDPKHGA